MDYERQKRLELEARVIYNTGENYKNFSVDQYIIDHSITDVIVQAGMTIPNEVLGFNNTHIKDKEGGFLLCILREIEECGHSRGYAESPE